MTVSGSPTETDGDPAWRPGGDEPTGLKDRVLRMASGYTRTQKIVAGVAVLGVVLGVVLVSKMTGGGDWAPLYTDLSPEDGNAIVSALEEEGVPHQLGAGGSTILVPADRVYDTRLSLSDTALPSEGKVGYGVLDSQGLTTSEFGQRVGYQRAMEGELASTIKALEPVETAVVHLALPADEVFAIDDKKASASVLVRTRPGQMLSDDQVRAITNLVSSSIEGLTPEAVTVADSEGNVLAAPGQGVSGENGDGQRQKQTARFEADLQASLESMLAGVVGVDSSRVTVSADLDFDETNTSRETFEAPEPNSAGEQLTLEESVRNETFAGANPADSGVLGPDTPAVAGAAGDSEYSLDEADVRYAVNRVVESTNTAPGAIENLSVAVIVDESAITAEQAAELSVALAAGAGIKEDRGDVLSVTRMPFDRTSQQAAQAELEAAEAAEAAAERRDTIRDITVVVALVLLLIAAALSYRWAARRHRRGDELDAMFTDPPELPPAPSSLLDEADDGDVVELSAVEEDAELFEGEIDEDEGDLVLAPLVFEQAAITAEHRQREARDEHLAQLIEHQPDEVAALLRNWLGDRRGVSR